MEQLECWDELLQTILIVDDEQRMRSSLRTLLEGNGWDILECRTGAEAVTTMKSRTVDLILLDINLPDISGLDVMEWVANNNISTSVIVVSGDDNIDSAIFALRSGAAEYVRKPYEPEEIRRKVENILYRRHLEASHSLMTSRLEHSELMHRFLVESSPDLIFTLDHSGCFTFINGRIESLLGYTREELIGACYESIVHEDDIEKAHYAFNERRRDSRATTNLEVRLKRNNNCYRNFKNNSIVVMMSSTGIYNDKCPSKELYPHCFLGTYGVARDITERKIAEETIAFQAFHDQLTRLPNQRLFKDRLEVAIAHSKRHGGMVGVMFIDLDRFKIVNDTHGHAAGDELLKCVAHRLRHCMRAVDTLARQGGDEFTVLLPDMVHAEDAAIIAQKILNEFNLPFLVSGQTFYISASIGIAIAPRDGDDIDTLLKNADIAMYKVKSCGKNNFKFFTPDMDVCNYKRISLENELRQAISNSEFELFYQPQIDISGVRIIGLEALIRWRHPAHGLLNPGDFIDLAEEAGLIDGITDWVLAEACRQLAHWQKMGLRNLRMAINVSPKEFERDDMVEQITSQIQCNHLPPDSLEIEITEKILLRDTPSVIHKMRMLRDRGVRISVDDFGTCYSSLNYLRQFPISTIKIDQSFVRDLSEEHRISPIIQAIIGIAHGFGLHLLAEGVETRCQMKTLHELGCNEMQGYLFSKAVSAQEVEHLMRRALSHIPPQHDEFIAQPHFFSNMAALNGIQEHSSLITP
ncbi:MAG: EAL domain-containing protein [Desulfuromonadales bacterium]|nr:EAL domain-containing protein [Desulfuromonadales bacterium]